MVLLRLISLPYRRFKNEVFFQDLLKSIAILVMIIDHAGFYFFPEELWLRAIGRVSAPIWFFFVGYNYKFSNTHLDQIFYFAVFLQLIICFVGNNSLFPLNILFTIIISKRILAYYEQYIKNASVGTMFLVALVIVLYSPTNNFTQYGILGVYMSLWGYHYKHRIGNKLNQLLLSFILIFITQSQVFNFAISEQIIFVILLCLTKYALYVYSPIKLNINGLLKYIINISSRYSLYIYCMHVILFITLSKYIENAN